MNPTEFPYENKLSKIFKTVKRPVAKIKIWSNYLKGWVLYTMVVDTGADYTVLSVYNALTLGIDVKSDCEEIETIGIGGKQKIYFYNKKIKIKIGDRELKIPIGFANSSNIPAILGRQECLDNFKITFHNFKTTISSR